MVPTAEDEMTLVADARAWPGVRPYDVVFYRSRGAKAEVNIASQHIWDLHIFSEKRKFTHCALVSSELTAIEAYPRAVRGPTTGLVHPGGVRFVPVADLCSDSRHRYRDFAVLRAPFNEADDVGQSSEAMSLGWSLLKHRYGLRRFFGLRRTRLPGEAAAPSGTEWMSCADIVQKVLFASGRFGVRARDVVGPGTLFRELSALGWQDVAHLYAPERFAARQQLFSSATGQASLDAFAVSVAWVVGSLNDALRRQQYRLEQLLNAQFAFAGPGRQLDEAIGLLERLRSNLHDEPARSADCLILDLKSRRGLLK